MDYRIMMLLRGSNVQCAFKLVENVITIILKKRFAVFFCNILIEKNNKQQEQARKKSRQQHQSKKESRIEKEP